MRVYTMGCAWTICFTEGPHAKKRTPTIAYLRWQEAVLLLELVQKLNVNGAFLRSAGDALQLGEVTLWLWQQEA